MFDTIYSNLLKKTIYPLLQLRKPDDENWLHHLNTLEKTQWWTSQELRVLQEKKLRMLINHAYLT